jgi:hypothetical protein
MDTEIKPSTSQKPNSLCSEVSELFQRVHALSRLEHSLVDKLFQPAQVGEPDTDSQS